MHALPLKTPWQRILQHAHQWPSSRIAGCHFEIPSDIQILDPESFLTYQTDDQIPNTGDCKLLIRVLSKAPLHACCQVLCEWSTDWPHDISLGPAESNGKNAGTRVVGCRWCHANVIPKATCDWRACAVCDHWEIFEHGFRPVPL